MHIVYVAQPRLNGGNLEGVGQLTASHHAVRLAQRLRNATATMPLTLMVVMFSGAMAQNISIVRPCCCDCPSCNMRRIVEMATLLTYYVFPPCRCSSSAIQACVNALPVGIADRSHLRSVPAAVPAVRWIVAHHRFDHAQRENPINAGAHRRRVQATLHFPGTRITIVE